MLSDRRSAGGEAYATAFAEPTLLYLPFPGNPTGSPPGRVGYSHEGKVELSLAVNERGTPRNVQAIETVPEDLVTIKYVRATRLARYRPAFRDGSPVRTEGVTVVHTFRYADDTQAE